MGKKLESYQRRQMDRVTGQDFKPVTAKTLTAEELREAFVRKVREEERQAHREFQRRAALERMEVLKALSENPIYGVF